MIYYIVESPKTLLTQCSSRFPHLVLGRDLVDPHGPVDAPDGVVHGQPLLLRALLALVLPRDVLVVAVRLGVATAGGLGQHEAAHAEKGNNSLTDDDVRR